MVAARIGPQNGGRRASGRGNGGKGTQDFAGFRSGLTLM